MKNLIQIIRREFWRLLLLLLITCGFAGIIVRIIYGLGGATNLSDKFPWGLWKGFNVVTGIALGAGGFTIAGTVYIFNLQRYKPILRPAILTAFLGYSLMGIALLVDIGLPHRFWHPLVMWNPHSVLFEVFWCVVLYLTVLVFELSPVVLERLGWWKLLKFVKVALAPLVLFGVILSTLHQSSLGSLFLIVPYKLYPLWYSQLLPVFFFISAIALGLSMVIFASWHAERSLGKSIPFELLSGLSRVLVVLLTFYISMRFLDLLRRGALPLLLANRMETWLFLLECTLLVVPAVLFYLPATRGDATKLYVCATLVILGVVTNRLNVSVTGLEAGSGTHYVPRWSEWSITLSLIGIAFAAFYWAAKHLPIFPEPKRQDFSTGPQELREIVAADERESVLAGRQR